MDLRQFVQTEESALRQEQSFCRGKAVGRIGFGKAMLFHSSGSGFGEPHGAGTAPSTLQAKILKFHTDLPITKKDTV